MKTAIAGYPRIGARRELKFRTEEYFRGEIDETALSNAARAIRLGNWMTLKGRGIDSIPSNDFSLYDGMLDAACLIGAVPARFRDAGLSPLDRYFAMARGNAAADLKALPMRKWFNTNYHYLVPELGDDTTFTLEGDKPFAEYGEALTAGIKTRPFIIGPFTFLSLASYTGAKTRRDFVPGIAQAYRALLERCARESGGSGPIGAIEFGENALVTDLTAEDLELFSELYRDILSAKGDVSVRLHTSFGDLRDSWGAVMDLPFDGVALDFVEGTENLALLERFGFPTDRELVAGVISGKNVWKCDRAKTLALVDRVAALSGCTDENGRLSIGASCPLLHVPVSARAERSIDPAVLARLSFAEEKLDELAELAELTGPTKPARADSRAEPSREAERAELARRIAALSDADWTRKPSRAERKAIQRARFGFPPLPTTTIGSFPQTSEVQANRARLRKGEIGPREYDENVRRMIAECVAFQERIGLDVLVHGEFERNDMVEFFGQSLSGFAFTERGWVQSYGTRCVKPPIIASDVRRTKPMTVELAAYAQSLSEKPVKGMLTGPVTILNWSFPREDIPLAESAFQIALAIRDEVLDLERNGIAIIQIDEAALKEKLPLRKADRDTGYLDWAIRAFRLCASGVRPETQIHTHMCYSDFTDIIPAIDALDADVITFEAARSNLSILDALANAGFETDVGPGVYDIHSPRVPSVEELTAAIGTMLEKLGKNPERYDGLWVNPDCGLKTRRVTETEESLRRLVEAAKRSRHANRG
jgi:5-methyltetrahydropteroyltriglutamate--homocysteine methyltransferase